MNARLCAWFAFAGLVRESAVLVRLDHQDAWRLDAAEPGMEWSA